MRPDRGPVRLLKDAGKAYLDKAAVAYRHRFEMVRLGFTGEAFLLYDLANNDPDDFVPNDMWGPLLRTNGPTAMNLLGNKLLFWHTYSSELPMPPVLAIAANGRLKPVADRGVTSLGRLIEMLEDGPLILKPIDGQKGRRVHSLARTGGELLLDGKQATPSDVERALLERDGMLVVGFARQAEYAAKVFPDSTNTVRVVMFGGEGTGNQPFVSAMAHRFGTRASAPVDNQSSGGVMGRLDPDTHRLGPACTYPFGAPRLVWHDDHPDTGSPIAGVEVPGLRRVLDRLHEFMAAHAYLTYVGWDIVVAPGTPDGFTILEANYGAALQTQMFGFPYRRDERVMTFLRHHGLADRLRDGGRRAPARPAATPAASHTGLS